MGVKVSNLTIAMQAGVTDSVYASWEFNSGTTSSSTGVIKSGDTVSIVGSGAVYYNGVAIPDWVKGMQWKVTQVTGDRAVLGKNATGSGSYDIQSPINVKYLSNGGGSSSTVQVDKLDHFNVRWFYDSGDGIWFDAGESQVNKNPGHAKTTHNYSIPSNAIRVCVWVTPVSKTYKVNDTDQSYWTGELTRAEFNVSNAAPPDVSTPTVTIDKCKITATVSVSSSTQYAGRIDKVRFEVYKDATKIKTCDVAVSAGQASLVYSVDPGGKYKVRSKAVNIVGTSSILSPNWSDFSSFVYSSPSKPSGFKSCKAESKTSVRLEWNGNLTNYRYDIEYTKDSKYFDISDQTTTISSLNTLTYLVKGLETGNEYFFRIRAVSATDSNAKSDWSGISSVAIGSKPSAPTTWSSSSSLITGEDLYLYWVHNSKDNSRQEYAKLEVYINDSTIPIIEYTIDPDEEEKTSSYKIVTSGYTEGTKISWRVCTAGVTNEFGDWSIQRDVNIYASPTLSLSILSSPQSATPLSTITSFPFYLKALPGPAAQTPIGYNIEIISNSAYECLDERGMPKYVGAGDIVYSKYFNSNTVLLLDFKPENIDLQNGVEYTLNGIVSMNSGLTGTDSIVFDVSWTDDTYNIETEFSIDETSLVAYIRPYCPNTIETTVMFDKLTWSYQSSYNRFAATVPNMVPYENTNRHSDGFVVNKYEQKTDETNNSCFCSTHPTNGTTLIYVYDSSYTDATLFKEANVDTYLTYNKTIVLPELSLSVYRRNSDNSFTEIETGIKNSLRPIVIDPHPTLNYARYRIVAIDDNTGAISYYDTPLYVVDEKAIVIQWDEEWSPFNTYNASDPIGDKPYNGSMLKLPYNIDVDESNNIDSSFINYIGRSHPVSYYGTHLGETSKWSTVIPKYDEETLYGLRRLSKWLGDVYVREPSGLGYWASVKVSFNQKHKNLTIPVSIDITRVEGGK